MDNALDIFATFVGNELALALGILNSTYVINAISLSQLVAGSLLALKVGTEALQVYVLHTAGDPNADPGGLLRRTAMAAAIIGGVPWLVRTVYTWGGQLAMAVADLSAVNPTPANFLDTLVTAAPMPVFMIITALAATVIWALILIQTGIRAVELAALAAVGPIMAVGLTSVNEGVAGVWWRELVVLSASQAVQTFLIKGFLATIMTFTFNSDVLKLFMLIGWLWVAFKTPTVLRQFAYHSGIGGVAVGAAQQAGTMYIMRRMLTKG
ncbi:MAG: hypothetical protein PWP65_958 [Clostridia bacterium]|nr:hypothetical protein [Clostridia bacterium]